MDKTKAKLNIDALLEKKRILSSEITEIRDKRGEILRAIDENSKDSKDPVTLLEELYKLNKQLNNKRDKLDDVIDSIYKAQGYY